MTSSTPHDSAASDGGTTAETVIEFPGSVTMSAPAEKRSIDALAEYAADVLAANTDLPAPVYYAVSQSAQQVSFMFDDTPASFRALAEWAERLGSTVISQPHTYDGWQSVHCQMKYTDHGVNVEAFAFIKIAKAAPATT
jgi:hypothetical protein